MLSQVVRTAFSPSGTFLATASYDRTIKIYRLSAPGTSASQSAQEDGDEEAEDPLLQDVSLRWELVHELTVKSNPEGLVFGPNDAWLAFTTRFVLLLFVLLYPFSSILSSQGYL